MKPGEVVKYNGEDYILRFIYESSYCEIQKANGRFQYELVHLSELTSAKKLLVRVNVS